jgi:hypothetical protein
METPEKYEPTQMETTILGCEAVISQMVFQAMLLQPDSPEMAVLGDDAFEAVLLIAAESGDVVGEA